MGALVVPAVAALGLGGGIQSGMRREKEANQNRLELTQLAQMGKYDGNASTTKNPILGRTSPQMANSPQERLGRMAPTNSLVATALAKQNLDGIMGGNGFSGTLSPGQTAFNNGRPVASLPSETKASEGYRPGQTREFQSGMNKITQEWDGTKWTTLGQGPAYKPDSPEKGPAPFNPNDPKVLRGEEDQFRNEFKPATQELQATQSSHKVLKGLLSQGTPLSVTYAVKALERAFEPGTIVRPQDIDAINNAQGLIAQLNANIEKYKTGIPANDPLRKQIEQVADSLLQSKQQAYNDYVSTYEPVLQSRGINLKAVAPLLSLPGPTPKEPSMSDPGFDFSIYGGAAKGNVYNPRTGRFE